MTILMACLECGAIVENPRKMQMMYEKCDVCLTAHREREELAIDTYLDQRAEEKRDAHA